MTEHGSYFAIRINSSTSITKQLHSFHLSQHFKKSFVRDLDGALEAWYLLDLGFINFSSTGRYITKQVHCIRQLSLCSDSLQLWEFQSIQRFLISYSEKTCSSDFFPINLTQKPFIQSKIFGPRYSVRQMDVVMNRQIQVQCLYIWTVLYFIKMSFRFLFKNSFCPLFWSLNFYCANSAT